MSLLSDLRVLQNVRVEGNLNVKGKTTSINAANFNTADAVVYLNKDYTSTTTSRGGGLAVNNEVSSTEAISSIVGGLVTTSSAHGFDVGDIVQLSGLNTAADDGVYVVSTVPLPTTFTVGGTLATPFDDVVQTGGLTDQNNFGLASSIVLGVWALDENGDVITSFGSSSAAIDANKGTIQEGDRPLLANITGDITVGSDVTLVPRTYYIDPLDENALVTITLPELSTSPSWEGRRITFVRDSESIVPNKDLIRISAASPETIEGLTNIILELTPYEKVTLIANTTRPTGGPSDGPIWVIE